jgi:hypothetical protein
MWIENPACKTAHITCSIWVSTVFFKYLTRSVAVHHDVRLEASLHLLK